MKTKCFLCSAKNIQHHPKVSMSAYITIYFSLEANTNIQYIYKHKYKARVKSSNGGQSDYSLVWWNVISVQWSLRLPSVLGWDELQDFYRDIVLILTFKHATTYSSQSRYWYHLNPLYPPLLPAVEQTRIWQKLASDQVWMLIMAEITNQFKKGNHVQFQSLIGKNTRHIKIPWHREYLWQTWYYDHCRIVNGNVARLRRASGTFVTWSVDDPSLMIWLQVLQGGEAVRNCDQTHIIGLL